MIINCKPTISKPEHGARGPREWSFDQVEPELFKGKLDSSDFYC